MEAGAWKTQTRPVCAPAVTRENIANVSTQDNSSTLSAAEFPFCVLHTDTFLIFAYFKTL